MLFKMILDELERYEKNSKLFGVTWSPVMLLKLIIKR